MGPEEGRSYDREVAAMAAGASPGIVRGAPMQHTLGGRFPSPLEVMTEQSEADVEQATRRDAEMPKSPYGSLRASSALNAPVQPIHERILELASQVVKSSHLLAEVRAQHQAIMREKQKAEDHFAVTSDALIAAMMEHREGRSTAGMSTASTSPEGVPYQAEGMR